MRLPAPVPWLWGESWSTPNPCANLRDAVGWQSGSKMWVVRNEAEMKEVEETRALVGVYVDRAYSPDSIEWLFQARNGFDEHARDAWHLLIPTTQGYAVDQWVGAEQYNIQLARGLIEQIGIGFDDLPCIVFRANGDQYYFLKLGGKSKEQFLQEIGLIADLARECQTESTAKGQAFRDYVNMQVANHLRRRRLLSAAKSAIPAISTLLGAVVDVRELV